MNLTALHKAALVRAYRTLAQGLTSGAITTALVAALAAWMNGEPARAALVTAAVAFVTTVGAAINSFWFGVRNGLPEVDPLAGAISVTPAVGSDGSALARVELANGIEEYLPAGAVKRKRAAKASTS